MFVDEQNNRIAHLGFIQGIIARMGANSFLLKGWSVTLVAAMAALAAKDADKSFFLLAFFPVFIFWWLDGFYLHTEKLYRRLYEKVADGRLSSEKFNLDVTELKCEVPGVLAVMFSKTLLPFHLVVIGVVLLTMFVLCR